MQYVDGPRVGADGAPLMLVLPLLPGQSEPWRRFLQELQASRRAAFDVACRRWGIRSLTLSLASARARDVVVVQVVLATDLDDAEERFARSRQPFDLWIAEQARALHGVDLRCGVARYRAEAVAVWPEQAPPAEDGLPITSAGRSPGRNVVAPAEQTKGGESSRDEIAHCGGS